jgi:hypothetical protein
MTETLSQTTLNGAIDAEDVSLVVASDEGFPDAGPFFLRIEDESIMVGDIIGTTCASLTRGAEGTQAADHADGTDVRLQLTLEQLYNYLVPLVNWTPASSGFLVSTAGLFDCLQGASKTPDPLAGRLLLAKLFVSADITVSKVCFVLSDAAASPDGVADSYFSLYSASGTLIAKTAESSAALIDPNGYGLQELTLTAEAGQSLDLAGGPGCFYYVGSLYGMIVSAPSLYGIRAMNAFMATNFSSTQRNSINAGASAASLYYGVTTDTSLTSPPASVVIADMVDTVSGFVNLPFPFFALK